MEYFEHDRYFCEVDSDNENPLIQSDEEGCSDSKKGQLFENVKILKKALIYYNCQTHTTWNYYHNEPHRLHVKCKFYGNECHWKLSVRHTKEHECLQGNSNFLAEEYQEKLLKHPTWKLKLFIKDVEDTYGVRINRWQAARAKKFSLSACAKGETNSHNVGRYKKTGVVTPRIRAMLNDFKQAIKNWRPIEASTN
ncbi:DNA repair protein RecO, partial [Bienertia sinuspersici]